MKMKKISALFLALTLVFTVVPTNAFAAEPTEKEVRAELNEVIEESKSYQGLEVKKNDADKKGVKATDVVTDAKDAVSSVKRDALALSKCVAPDKAVADERILAKKQVSADRESTLEYPVLNGDYVYSSLQYAVDCAEEGDTLVLLADLQFEGAIITGKNLTIDMNGYYIGGSYSDMMIGINDSYVQIVNSSSDASSIMNIGTGNDIIVTGYSEVYISNVSFMTEAVDSTAVIVGEDAYVQVRDCGFYNGSIIDGTPAFVGAVCVNEYAYADIKDCEVIFDEGLGVYGKGDVNVLESSMYMDDGYAVATLAGGNYVISEGNYIAGNAVYSKGGDITIHEGVFESMYYDTPAITSDGANNGTNITIASGSVARPSNWKTVDKDIIAVIKNMSKPGSTKVNLSGSYNKIKATWNKVSGATGYAVYYKKGTGSYKLWGKTTKTSATIKNLTAGSKYTVKVVPYKLCEGFYGEIEAQGTNYSTAYTYTLKKVTLKTFQKSGTKVRVRWNNISGETGYQISKSTKKTGTNIVSTYKTTSGTSKLISATKGKTYYYKVRAYKTVNGSKIYGPWSSVKSYKR